MRTLEELQAKLNAYKDVEFLYDPTVGLIAWRNGTGDNLELLFIETVEHRQGHGTTLYRRMVNYLQTSGQRPYHSVFGFRLASNDAAGAFYAALGWEQADLGRSIYGGDGTVIMWIAWDELVRKLGAGAWIR